MTLSSGLIQTKFKFLVEAEEPPTIFIPSSTSSLYAALMKVKPGKKKATTLNRLF